MIALHTPYPVEITNGTDWLTVIINALIALGTVGASIVAVRLAYVAYRDNKTRKSVETEIELRRQAELQAVSVRFDTGWRRNDPNDDYSWLTDVRVTNDSNAAIYDVQPWFMVSDVKYPAPAIGRLEAHDMHDWTVRAPGPADEGPASGDFCDSYGRLWSVDWNRALTLTASNAVTANARARENLGRAVE